MTKHRFILLDGLRGIAAIGVVLTHVASREIPALLSLYLLVDFFFVLSGFVLNPLMPKPGFAFWPQFLKFFWKRALRFFPMVLAVVTFRVGTCATWSLLDKPSQRYCPETSGFEYGISFAAAVMLLQILVPTALIYSGPLWSLSAEWFANLLAAPLTATRTKIPLLGGLAVGYAMLLFGYLNMDSSEDLFVGFGALGRALIGFVAGLMLRQFFDSRKPRTSVVRVSLASLLVIALFWFQRSPYRGALALATPVFAVFVYQVASVRQGNLPIGFLRIASYLGFISFGVYAWHGNMRFLLATFQDDADLGPYVQHSVLYAGVITALTLLMSVGMSHLTDRCIDRPLHNRLNKRFNSPSAIPSNQ